MLNHWGFTPISSNGESFLIAAFPCRKIRYSISRSEGRISGQMNCLCNSFYCLLVHSSETIEGFMRCIWRESTVLLLTKYPCLKVFSLFHLPFSFIVWCQWSTVCLEIFTYSKFCILLNFDRFAYCNFCDCLKRTFLWVCRKRFFKSNN